MNQKYSTNKRFNNALFVAAINELFRTQMEAADKLKISGPAIHYMIKGSSSVSIVIAKRIEFLSNGKYKAVDLCTAEREPRGKQNRVYSQTIPDIVSRCNDGEITIRYRYMPQNMIQ